MSPHTEVHGHSYVTAVWSDYEMVHDLDWLLGSVGRDHFFDRYFEKEILDISDRDRNYYENMFSEGDPRQDNCSVSGNRAPAVSRINPKAY